MPKLDWIGKQYVVNHTDEVPFRLLEHVPQASMGDDSGSDDSGNVIVHGDNLEALKALLPYYHERVKLVFIDPPYNTGNESWVYNDRMNAPKIKEWLGKVVGGEGEDLSRHDKWLCMMYPRLVLLRELLKPDGMIFISIGDNEVHRLRMLMDEVFGVQNFLSCAVWQKRVSPDSDETFATNTHDYIVTYGKNKNLSVFNRLARTSEADARYSNPDNDERGPWTSSDLTRREYREHDFYPIELPSGREVWPAAGRSWGVPKETFEKLVADNRVWFGASGDAMPRRKRFLSEVREGMVPTTWWTRDEFGDNQAAKRELRRLFPDVQDIFATPKPTLLIQRIIELATDVSSNDIVLDSFAGSGTTAHAVLKQNAEDGGDRHFVMVEMEDYADTLTAERVRRVIRGEGGQPYLGPETGFDFFELGEELLTESGDDVNPEIKRDELGRFVLFLETGTAAEGVAENGAGYVGSGNGKDVYLFYAPDTTATFGEEQLRALPDGEAERVVYADRCAVDEEELLAHGVAFRKIPRDVRDLITRFNKDRSR